MRTGMGRETTMNTFLTRTLIVIFAVTFSFAAVASAAPTGKTYATPDKAVEAFISALRTYNLQTLVKIFGKGSERMFVSEDPVVDEQTRTGFLQLYDVKHALAQKEDGSRILLVGNDPWPMPIPIVKSGSKWAFDTAAGLDEIINRRIGRNELEAIQTILAIADAQREYYRRDRDGDGILEYAKKFASTVGLRDGLFWRVEDDERPSPLGPLVADAASEGYTRASSSYHGYHFRLLSSQGSCAPGGAYDYMARENQMGGFAVLAYPADYGDSGVVTFIVNHSGVVYQRDLGESTEAEALKITTFDPCEGWTMVGPKDIEPLPAE